MKINEIKDQILKEWKGVKDKPFLICTLFYYPVYILGWFEFVFKKLATTMDAYFLLEDKDPVIAVSLAGFMMLSLWFTVRVIEPCSTYVTITTYKMFKTFLNEVKERKPNGNF